jgi:hypothetical protein
MESVVRSLKSFNSPAFASAVMFGAFGLVMGLLKLK